MTEDVETRVPSRLSAKRRGDVDTPDETRTVSTEGEIRDVLSEVKVIDPQRLSPE